MSDHLCNLQSSLLSPCSWSVCDGGLADGGVQAPLHPSLPSGMLCFQFHLSLMTQVHHQCQLLCGCHVDGGAGGGGDDGVVCDLEEEKIV